MSSTIKLFIVDPSKLANSMENFSNLERLNRLKSLVSKIGAEWASFEVDLMFFSESLEFIDALIGGTCLLADFSFTRSPNNLLGDDFGPPFFGYFSPQEAKDFDLQFQDLPDEIDTDDTPEDEYRATILASYRSTFHEAVSRGYSVAVLHS